MAHIYIDSTLSKGGLMVEAVAAQGHLSMVIG
jgi:hypothetical protein